MVWKSAAIRVAAVAVAFASVARAKAMDAVVLPTVTPVEGCVTCPALHRPSPEVERQIAAIGRELDTVVVDAAQDLGLTVDVSARPEPTLESPSEQALVSRAETSWVFSPRIALDGDRIVVRIVAVRPGSPVLLIRTEELKPSELEVRTVLMMRDLVHAAGAKSEAAAPIPAPNEQAVVHAARSKGRAVLALNAAALGGYIGFALQRAGGSNDARLTYPLIALGAGIGVGGSMIAAEEWDVDVGDAWYLSAGMWWPTIGALLATSHEPDRKRFIYGAGAAAGGAALATTSLSFGGMAEGGALVAHSGGAFGLLLGGVADLAVQGRTDVTPMEGMGIGAISGVVIMGTLARFTRSPTPSRVLLVDLSGGLGALGGAALASPLVFGNHVGALRNRLWLSSIALGTLVGATVGFFTTAGAPHETREAAAPAVTPFAGVIDRVSNPDGTSSPVTGAGVRGVF